MSRRRTRSVARPAAPAAQPRPRRARYWVSVLGGLALAGGAWLTWSALHTPQSQPSGAARLSHNVLLITLDTTRADFLGCYGGTTPTPNLDRLARDGALFRRAASCSPQTLPSHCSIMTGVYPFVHGVRRNQTAPLPASATTLAENLRAAGAATQAVVASAVLDRAFGIDQGFDVYREIPRGKTPEGLPQVERRGDEVCHDAIEMLRELAPRRFFLWVHFFDPHHPYESSVHTDIESRAAYADEVAFMDNQVGRLLDELERLRLAGHTLVVAVGDHGEGLGDHDEYQHGFFVYETTLHVPCIVRCPGVVPAGQVVRAQVRTIDLAPTVLELVGGEPLPGIQGVSLRPLLVGESVDLGLEAYGEAFEAHTVFGLARLRSLARDGWKYILAPRPELYHLLADPNELENLAERNAQHAEQERARLRETIVAAPPPFQDAAAGAQPDAEQLARLEALGYVGTFSDPAAQREPELATFEPTGGNPRDFASAIGLALRAHRTWVLRNYAQAEVMLREVLRHLPESVEMQRDLAFALDQQGKADEAAPLYAQVLAATPHDAETRRRYALALAKLKQWAGVIEQAQQVVQTLPQDAVSHALLGAAYSALRQLDQAATAYQTALAHDPRNVAALYGLAAVYRDLGRTAEAADLLRSVLQLQPDNAAARAALEALPR